MDNSTESWNFSHGSFSMWTVTKAYILGIQGCCSLFFFCLVLRHMYDCALSPSNLRLIMIAYSFNNFIFFLLYFLDACPPTCTDGYCFVAARYWQWLIGVTAQRLSLSIHLSISLSIYMYFIISVLYELSFLFILSMGSGSGSG